MSLKNPISFHRLADAFAGMSNCLSISVDFDAGNLNDELYKFTIYNYFAYVDLFIGITSIVQTIASLDDGSFSIKGVYPAMALTRPLFELAANIAVVSSETNARNRTDFLKWSLDIQSLLNKKHYFDSTSELLTNYEKDLRQLPYEHPQFIKGSDLNDKIKKIEKMISKKRMNEEIFIKPALINALSNSHKKMRIIKNMLQSSREAAEFSDMYAYLSNATHGNISYFLDQYEINKGHVTSVNAQNYQTAMLTILAVTISLCGAYFHSKINFPSEDAISKMCGILNDLFAK